MVHAAAPTSAMIMTRRRSQRSTSAPATGSSRMLGNRVHAARTENANDEPVFSSTQTPRANDVSPEPTAETS